MRNRYGYSSSADRFVNYRELTARRSEPASCSHAVKAGDIIGWHPKLKTTKCAACWSKWVAENAAAEADERMYSSGYGGY